MMSRDFAYKDFERRMKKKDPEWKTSKLPPGEMKRLMDKALVREQKKTMITGALVTAAFVGGAFGLAKASGLNTRNTRIGVGLVGATAGKQVVDLLISQSTAKKFIRESDKQDALEAERERRGR